MSNLQGCLTIQTDGNTDELFNLFRWLNKQDALRGRVSLPPKQIRPGEMGGLSDALVVAVGQYGIGPALVTSLAVWLRTRRSDLTMTIRCDEHTEISVDAKRIAMPEVAQALENMIGKLRPPE